MSVLEVLDRVATTLETARYGLADLTSPDPGRQLSGLRNLVVFGRAVTNVLQNLRGVAPDFDAWYQPWVQEMRDDPLLRYFYTLRSEILKKGSLQTARSVYISSFSLPTDLRRFGPPPPGATGFFIGDANGGTGWHVRLPDGTEEAYYVSLPADIGTISIVLSDPPSPHLGRPLPRLSADHLASLYCQYLERLTTEARAHFLGASEETSAPSGLGTRVKPRSCALRWRPLIWRVRNCSS